MNIEKTLTFWIICIEHVELKIWPLSSSQRITGSCKGPRVSFSNNGNLAQRYLGLPYFILWWRTTKQLFGGGLIGCEAMCVVFHSNFAAYIVCRHCKPCEFPAFAWTDCWGNKSYYVITSPANTLSTKNLLSHFFHRHTKYESCPLCIGLKYNNIYIIIINNII